MHRLFRLISVFLFLWILNGCASTEGIDANCPGRGDLWPSDELWEICFKKLPDSFLQCEANIADLSSKDDATLQDRYNVAFFRPRLAQYVENASHSSTHDMILESRNELRALAEEYPYSFDVIERLAYFESDDYRRFALHWRMMELAPSCTDALYWLVSDGVGPYDFDRDPSDLTARRVSERLEHRNQLLLYGYEHGSSKKERMYFAVIWFHELWNNQDTKLARKFRHRVIDDLGLVELDFDDRSRTESLELICHSWSFGMGFAPLCVEAIEQLTKNFAGRSKAARTEVVDAIGSILYEISERLEYSDPQQLVLFLDGVPEVRYQYGTEVADTVDRLVKAFLRIPQASVDPDYRQLQAKLNELQARVIHLVDIRKTQRPAQHDVDPHVLLLPPPPSP